MAYTGKEIRHPVAGERAIFRQTARDTGGELLEIDVFMSPRGFVTVEHVHPRQEERFEIVSGAITMTIRGEEQVVGAGETRVVPRNTSHVWRNRSDVEEAHVRVEFRPAGTIEYLFENVAGLAVDGKVNPKTGLPGTLQMAVLGKAYGNDMLMSRPPQWVQRTFATVVAPIGRLKGYKARYPQYTD